MTVTISLPLARRLLEEVAAEFRRPFSIRSGPEEARLKRDIHALERAIARANRAALVWEIPEFGGAKRQGWRK